MLVFFVVSSFSVVLVLVVKCMVKFAELRGQFLDCLRFRIELFCFHCTSIFNIILSYNLGIFNRKSEKVSFPIISLHIVFYFLGKKIEPNRFVLITYHNDNVL